MREAQEVRRGLAATVPQRRLFLETTTTLLETFPSNTATGTPNHSTSVRLEKPTTPKPRRAKHSNDFTKPGNARCLRQRRRRSLATTIRSAQRPRHRTSLHLIRYGPTARKYYARNRYPTKPLGSRIPHSGNLPRPFQNPFRGRNRRRAGPQSAIRT